MQKGKSKRTRMYLFLDVGLTVAFVYSLRPFRTGLSVHEWLGLAIGLALAVHLVVHWRWVAGVTRRIAGGLPARTWATYLLDVALAVAFGTIIVGGVVMSRVVLAQLGLPRTSSEVLSAIHKWASIVTVALVVAKLALHRTWIRRAFKRTVVDTLRIKLWPQQDVRKPLAFVITGVVVTGLLTLSGCDAMQVTDTAIGTVPMATQSPQPTNTPPPTATPTPTPTPVPSATATPTMTPSPTATPTSTPTPTPVHPLMISVMRERAYPGSDLIIEETLSPGFNYDRYVVSYLSEGQKIYALFTVPQGERPETGWPVIIFNHGYIPPDIYRTTERYVAYVDGFARNGYIVIKPDYRGHGFSEGTPVNSVGSPGYTVDVLNAMASAQHYPDADPSRVGMWGHSMGGSITVRAMVVSDAIKAGVIWAGTAASYEAWLTRWRNLFGGRATPTPNADGTPNRRWPERLTESYGSFEVNRAFWDAIDPTAHLAQLSGPLQLHHATTDETVPVAFSEDLDALLMEADVVHELYIYEGDNHNLSGSFGTAMARSVQFFDAYVKGVEADE